jgi:hypothetical protein
VLHWRSPGLHGSDILVARGGHWQAALGNAVDDDAGRWLGADEARYPVTVLAVLHNPAVATRFTIDTRLRSVGVLDIASV